MPRYLTLKGNPPNIDDELLTELGRAVMYWAWFENSLIADISALARAAEAAGMSAPYASEVPVAFKKRLALWFRLCRAAYADIPHYLAFAEQIRDAAQEIAESRNVLIHGHLAGYGDELPGGGVRLLCIQPAEGNRFSLGDYVVDLPFLKALTHDISRLFEELLSLTMNRSFGTHRWPDARS